MKIMIVYESMFGNTHEVAQAISDGIRQGHPDAEVECVPVADASPELITSLTCWSSEVLPIFVA